MLSEIKQALEERGLWKKGEPLLVGVSGGPDSVALLDALVSLQKDFGPLTVCHLNHKLRGIASDEDAEFVRQLATRHNLSLEIRSVDVQQLATGKKISVEMAAREARLDFFQGVAHRTGVSKIALAHTADDQAETVLLRLIRGAGREGLSAMEMMSHYRGAITIVRPMLRVWRTQVMSCLRERNLLYREDVTNLEDAFLRNRVRLKLLPWLERDFNSGIKPVLRRTAEILGEEEAFLDAMAEEQLRQCIDGMVLQVKPLMLRSVVLQRRIVRRWLARWMPLSELTFERVEAVLQMASETEGTATTEVGKGLVAVREYGLVRFGDTWTNQPLPRELIGEQMLPLPGELTLTEQGYRFSAELVSRAVWEMAIKKGMTSNSLTAYLAAETLTQPRLTLRTWREGDRFQPLGMSEEKKLQDFFVDEKVPKLSRSQVLLVECKGRITWVVGHRIADWAKVTEKTQRVVKLTAQPTVSP